MIWSLNEFLHDFCQKFVFFFRKTGEPINDEHLSFHRRNPHWLDFWMHFSGYPKQVIQKTVEYGNDIRSHKRESSHFIETNTIYNINFQKLIQLRRKHSQDRLFLENPNSSSQFPKFEYASQRLSSYSNIILCRSFPNRADEIRAYVFLRSYVDAL